MFPADSNENQQQLLSRESRKSIELCTKIRKQFQQAVLEGHREQQVMTVVDLMEEMQRGWRAASTENAQLREQNGRLKRQIENFETALAEARVENQRLNSQRAADQQLNAALQLELDQYKERFNRARLELQNAGLGIGNQPTTDHDYGQQKKVTPDEDTTEEEDDDENVFLAQPPTNNGAKDGLPHAGGGGGGHGRRRRSNSVGVLSDKQQSSVHFPSPFPVNPPKLVLGPLFVPSAAANANSTNRTPIPVQKSPPPQSRQLHQNHQLTPVSTRPRHRIPVRIGGTPPSRRKWGGNGEGNAGEEGQGQQYPPPSTEPRGKSFKYRLTPYSPATSIFSRQHQHRNNNHRLASPIPINLSTGSALLRLPPPPPPHSSKQQNQQPMKTILTTMENGTGSTALLPPLSALALAPSNPIAAAGGGIGPFLDNNGNGQQSAEKQQQQKGEGESTEKQYLPSIRPTLPPQWKPTLGKLY